MHHAMDSFLKIQQKLSSINTSLSFYSPDMQIC